MAVPTADAMLDQALAHHTAGRHIEAETGYRSVLASDPDNPDALNLLGVMLQETGAYQELIALISRALAIDPGIP